MDDDQEIDLRLTRRDAGRLLVGVRERRRKLERGHDKFKDNWDAEKGRNMAESLQAYSSLEKVLKEAMKHGDDHSRSAGRDTGQREGRWPAPGYYRETQGQT